MSHPRQPLIDSLIAMAEEAAWTMWHSYGTHFDLPHTSKDRKRKGDEIFERCMARNESVAKLRAERQGILGQTEGDSNHTPLRTRWIAT